MEFFISVSFSFSVQNYAEITAKNLLLQDLSVYTANILLLKPFDKVICSYFQNNYQKNKKYG